MCNSDGWREVAGEFLKTTEHAITKTIMAKLTP